MARLTAANKQDPLIDKLTARNLELVIDNDKLKEELKELRTNKEKSDDN